MKHKIAVLLTSLLILAALVYGFKFAQVQQDREFLQKDSREWARASGDTQAQLAARAIEVFQHQGLWIANTDAQQAQNSLVLCVNTSLRAYQQRARDRSGSPPLLSSLLFGCAMEQGWIQPRGGSPP